MEFAEVATVLEEALLRGGREYSRRQVENILRTAMNQILDGNAVEDIPIRNLAGNFVHRRMAEEIMEKEIQSPEMFPNSGQLREILETNPNILHRGERRGRLYRHKSVKPRLPDLVIAVIIKHIVQESPTMEMSREDISQVLFQHIEITHQRIDSGNLGELPAPVRQAIEENVPGHTYDSPSSTSEFGFQEWLSSNYSQHWFFRSWSNIQRLMASEKVGLVKGSLRGRWTTAEKLKQLPTPSHNPAEIVTALHALDDSIDRLAKSGNVASNQMLLELIEHHRAKLRRRLRSGKEE